MVNDRPAWIRRMENGHLGEVRTSAILADRFWVLTRSVDVEGADFLIQEREIGARPNRLGIVQAKFLQDDGTDLSVHRSYVEDSSGEPYAEFWLMAHTGTAGTAQVFLMSAAEVREVGLRSATERSDKAKFRLPGRDVLSPRFGVTAHIDKALAKISLSLRTANWSRNRNYITISGFAQSPPPPDWLELGIPNHYAWSLVDSLAEVRKRVREIAWEVSEKAELVDIVMSSEDPEAVLSACEDLEGLYDRDRRPRLFDEDHLLAVRATKKRADLLRDRHLVNPYQSLVEALKGEISSAVSDAKSVESGAYIWEFQIDFSSLTIVGSTKSEISTEKLSDKIRKTEESTADEMWPPSEGAQVISDSIVVWCRPPFAFGGDPLEDVLVNWVLEEVMVTLERD